MLKRLSTVLVFGGLLGLAPATAEAAPVKPLMIAPPDQAAASGYDLFHSDRDDDQHYRCMYRCKERYEHGRHKHKYHHHRHRHCWHYGPGGWYRARCGRPSHHDH